MKIRKRERKGREKMDDVRGSEVKELLVEGR